MGLTTADSVPVTGEPFPLLAAVSSSRGAGRAPRTRRPGPRRVARPVTLLRVRRMVRAGPAPSGAVGTLACRPSALVDELQELAQTVDAQAVESQDEPRQIRQLVVLALHRPRRLLHRLAEDVGEL